jgi:hypothetical protein
VFVYQNKVRWEREQRWERLERSRRAEERSKRAHEKHLALVALVRYLSTWVMYKYVNVTLTLVYFEYESQTPAVSCGRHTLATTDT